ncbi:MAG: MBL fold metallo-hydrolase [Deltaproteobacteria bacterium]|nr:MBL fold metallo-hydrolase [Deltaproteobacteria bacterium]MBN2672597.1 MBL fold metallo-hydrolase [Deltaproteobacteria bacterium]
MSTEFVVVPTGVGDAFSEKYYSSGFWIEYAGTSILVDCAHPVRKIMREAAISSGCDIRVESLDAIVMTHLHSDHASGLEGMGFYSYYVAQKPLPLLAHNDVMQDIWPYHLKGTMAPMCDPPDEQRTFQDFFVPMMLQENQPKQFGPFTIECRKTEHHIPTYALRISAGDRVFGYSADTSFNPALLDWLAVADFFVHETNVASHTPYEKLAALPDALRKKMRLIHYPDDFDKASSVIKTLEQGKKYVL